MAPPQVDLPDEAGWSAVSSGPLHVLVRAGGALVDRVRTAAEDGDLDDVLDALTRDGVRATPEFVAVREGEPCRVVARGRAYAVVSGPTGESTVRAAARGPWADEDAADGAERISLLTGSTPDSGPAANEPAAPAPAPSPAPSPAAEPAAGWKLPAVFGRATRQPGPDDASPSPAAGPGEVALPVGANPAVPPTAPATTPATTPEPAPDEVDEVEELPSYDHLFGATQHERPGYIEQHDTQGIVEPPIGHAPLESAGGFNPADAPGPADHTLAPPADTLHPPATARGSEVPVEHQPASPAPAPRAPVPPAPQAEAAPLAPPVKGGLIDSVPWRSGGSNVPAPDPTPAPTAAATPAPAPAAPTPAAPTPAAPTPAAPAPAPAAPAPAAPHTTVPVAPGPAPQPPLPAHHTPAAAADLTGPADEAEATVDRRALLGGSPAVDAGPMVLAVLCPAGHTSPPHSASCRVCGRDIPVQQPFTTPRPSLGVLRLQTGDVVQLDRGVLLGRSPKVNAELAAAARPHLVRVTSAQNDISRNHVEIVLEGWHVLIRDLESTNGTTVALPGQLPVRLRPSDQQVLEPGTVITLADEVSLTYEVSA